MSIDHIQFHTGIDKYPNNFIFLTNATFLSMIDEFNITWDKFISHGKNLLSELFETQLYSDVTLVSDDLYHFQAHKFLLSACSSVFKNILQHSSQHTFIHLRGVQHQQLQTILQFLYLGKAMFNQEQMNELSKVAEDLDLRAIKESLYLGKEVVALYDNAEVKEESTLEDFSHTDEFMENEESQNNKTMTHNAEAQMESSEEEYDSTKVTIEMKEIQINEDLSQTANPTVDSDLNISTRDKGEENAKLLEEKLNGTEISLAINESNEEPNPFQNSNLSVEADKTCDNMYSCDICDKKLLSSYGIQLHIQTAHQKLKFPCKKCKYVATQAGSLQHHVKSIHEGIKYPCKQCDYQATKMTDLRYHIQYHHEGIRYPCQQCDHQASRPQNLKHHVKAKHSTSYYESKKIREENANFACDLCDKKLSTMEGMKLHIASQHLKLKSYICQECGFQTYRRDNLKQHILSIHEGIKYPCPHCEYKATQPSGLTRHVKKQHQFQSQPQKCEPL